MSISATAKEAAEEVVKPTAALRPNWFNTPAGQQYTEAYPSQYTARQEQLRPKVLVS